MSGKDAEIERAFERPERDEERRAVPGAHFPGPIPIWEDPKPCPACGSALVVRIEVVSIIGNCLDCGARWPLETDNERENG